MKNSNVKWFGFPVVKLMTEGLGQTFTFEFFKRANFKVPES